MCSLRTNAVDMRFDLPVVFRDDRWWNAETAQELDAYIAGWRPFE